MTSRIASGKELETQVYERDSALPVGYHPAERPRSSALTRKANALVTDQIESIVTRAYRTHLSRAFTERTSRARGTIALASHERTDVL